MYNFDDIFPVSRMLLGAGSWRRLIAESAGDSDLEIFIQRIPALKNHLCLPDYISELINLEYTFYRISNSADTAPKDAERIQLNPTLEILHHRWPLAALFNKHIIPQKPGEEWLLIWKQPVTGEVIVKAATPGELFVCKLLADDQDFITAAMANGLTEVQSRQQLEQAVRRGLVLKPATRIKRTFHIKPGNGKAACHTTQSVPVFTLQWHITQACDLHCRHCYDRSDRSTLTMEQARHVIDQLRNFCDTRYVEGHVCLTGGNPFLHPSFFEIYEYAVSRNFSTSILGNPVTSEQLKRMNEIRKPVYFQVSLEGLKEYNDYIRGRGNFENVIEFLGLLREYRITSAVMLTLNKDNMDQVLPLAEKLRGHVDKFTYNRLSEVGSGINLSLPEAEAYDGFMDAYLDARRSNKIMGLKDNLLNIKRLESGEKTFGGCTGYGCGAAFSFLALLPDGEVHACRKFPSYLGNIFSENLSSIYDSEAAGSYRQGCSECSDCTLRPFCGGCLAISYSYKQDIFSQKDPHCLYRSLSS